MGKGLIIKFICRQVRFMIVTSDQSVWLDNLISLKNVDFVNKLTLLTRRIKALHIATKVNVKKVYHPST